MPCLLICLLVLCYPNIMRIILLQDIVSLGKKDDIKNVSDGYARNFLFPQKLAKQATESAVKILAAEKKEEAGKKSEEYKKYTALKEKIKSLKLSFKMKIGGKGKKTDGLFAGSLLTEASKASVIRKRSQGFAEEGKRAFGSVTKQKIFDELKKHGIVIEKDWILLDEPIKTAGEKIVEIKLPNDLVAEIKILIEPEK